MASPCNRNKAQKILTKSDHCNLIFNHPASGYDASSQKLQHRFRSGFVHVGFACGSGLAGWGLVFRSTARRSRLGTLKGEAIKFRICKHSSINLLMQGRWSTIPWMTLTLRCWSRHCSWNLGRGLSGTQNLSKGQRCHSGHWSSMIWSDQW
jgi:hypothetical protein